MNDKPEELLPCPFCGFAGALVNRSAGRPRKAYCDNNECMAYHKSIPLEAWQTRAQTNTQELIEWLEGKRVDIDNKYGDFGQGKRFGFNLAIDKIIKHLKGNKLWDTKQTLQEN